MKLTFAGSGDAFGSGGRFHTCFHVVSSDHTFLIDCGATSQAALRNIGADLNGIRTIFITHLHGDHFGGLPFFLLDAQLLSQRREPLTIAGPPGLEERLHAAQEVLFTGASGIKWRFDLEIIETEAGRSHAVNGTTVEPFEVEHFSGAPSHALRFTVDGKILTYSGDTEWVDTLIPASDNADLFICECYSFDKPMKFHNDYATLMEKRPLLTAKRIILTHMNQSMLDRLDEVELETAHDGLEINV